MSNKQATVYILDCSPAMAEAFAQAKAVLVRMLHEKLMTNKKTDFVAVVLFGQAVTLNPLATASDDGDGDTGYEHILVCCFDPNIAAASKSSKGKAKSGETASADGLIPAAEAARLMELVGATHVSSTAYPADPLSAVIVAAEILKLHCRELKYDKKIYLLTAGESETSTSGFDVIVQHIAEHRIAVSVVDARPSSPSPPKSATWTTLRQLTQDLTDAGILSHVFSLDEARESVTGFAKRPTAPFTLYRGPLAFGQQFSIDVSVAACTQLAKLPAFKKSFRGSIDKLERRVQWRRVRSEQEEQEEQAARASASQRSSAPPPIGNEVFGDDETQRIFRFGTTHVPLNVEELQLLERREERCLDVLGFVPMDQIRREWFMDGVMMVQADVRGAHWSENVVALKSLAAAMALDEDGRPPLCCLARYCRASNAPLKLVCLFPVEDLSGLYMVTMPFADDVREWTFVSLPLPRHSVEGTTRSRFKPTSEQMSAMEIYVDRLTLPDDEDDERYDVTEMFWPSYHHLSSQVMLRAVDPSSQVTDVDPRLLQQFERDPELWRDDPAKPLRDAFPVEKVVPMKRNVQSHVRATDSSNAPTLEELLSGGGGGGTAKSDTAKQPHVPVETTTIKPPPAAAKSPAKPAPSSSSLSSLATLPKSTRGMAHQQLDAFARSLFPANPLVMEFRRQWASDIDQSLEYLRGQITDCLDTLVSPSGHEVSALMELVYTYRAHCQMADDDELYDHLQADIRRRYLDDMVDGAVWKALMELKLLSS